MKKDSPDVLRAIILAWLGWQSLMLIQLLSRVAVVEDRIGVMHAKPERGHDRWSSFELFHVPELISKKKEKP